MKSAYKKKKDEKVFPPSSCSAAVALLEGVKDFPRAQHTQALDAIVKVEAYLSNLQSGVIKEDKGFIDNVGNLRTLLENVRDKALYYDMNPPIAEEGPSVSVSEDTFGNIARQAQSVWDTMSKMHTVEEDKRGTKLGLIPSREGQAIEHKSPRWPGLKLPQPVLGRGDLTITTQSVPDEMLQYLTTDEDENYDPAQISALENDLGQILTGYYNNMTGPGSMASEGGTNLWNHLVNFYGDEDTARHVVCGSGTSGGACTNLVNDLKNGNVQELLEGEYPISEALRQADETSTSHYSNARFAMGIDALWWLYANNKLRLGIKGGVNVWQMENHITGSGTIIAPDGTETSHNINDVEKDILVGGKALAVFELDLSKDVTVGLNAGGSYDVRPILPDRKQIATADVEIKLLGTGNITDETSLGNYVITISGSFGKDYRKYLGKAEGTLTLFQVGKSGHFIGIYGLANALRETGKGGMFEVTYNAAQLALGPQVDLNILRKEGASGQISLTIAPTILFYTDKETPLDLSDPEHLWGGIAGVRYDSGKLSVPNFTLGASIMEAPEGMTGGPITGGLQLEVEF